MIERLEEEVSQQAKKKKAAAGVTRGQTVKIFEDGPCDFYLPRPNFRLVFCR